MVAEGRRSWRYLHGHKDILYFLGFGAADGSRRWRGGVSDEALILTTFDLHGPVPLHRERSILLTSHSGRRMPSDNNSEFFLIGANSELVVWREILY